MRPTTGDSGALATTGVGSSRDGVSANAAVVAEAARVTLQQNDELGRILTGDWQGS